MSFNRFVPRGRAPRTPRPERRRCIKRPRPGECTGAKLRVLKILSAALTSPDFVQEPDDLQILDCLQFFRKALDTDGINERALWWLSEPVDDIELFNAWWLLSCYFESDFDSIGCELLREHMSNRLRDRDAEADY